MIELVKVEPELVKEGIDAFIERLAEIGVGGESFSSINEAVGAIAREYHGLNTEIHDGSQTEIEDKALDLAVQAFWLYMSMEANSRV